MTEIPFQVRHFPLRIAVVDFTMHSHQHRINCARESVIIQLAIQNKDIINPLILPHDNTYLEIPRFIIPHFWTLIILETMHKAAPLREQCQIQTAAKINQLQRWFLQANNIIDSPIVIRHDRYALKHYVVSFNISVKDTAFVEFMYHRQQLSGKVKD